MSGGDERSEFRREFDNAGQVDRTFDLFACAADTRRHGRIGSRCAAGSLIGSAGWVIQGVLAALFLRVALTSFRNE